MKIVFFTDFYHPSMEGVTASVELFARGLREKGHRVWIVAPAPAKPLASDHPDVIRLPSMPSVWYRGGNLRDGIMTPKIGRQIKALNADVFHFHTNGTVGLAGMRLMFEIKMPSIATYHTDLEQYSKIYRGLWTGLLTGTLIGPLLLNKPDAWSDTLVGVKPQRNLQAWNENMVRNLIRVCYQNFDEILVPSQKMLRSLQSYGITRPMKILPTGIEPADFPPHNAGAPTRSSRKPFQLLYVGRVAKEKNVDLMLDTVALLKKQHTPVELLLAGPGAYLAQAKRKATTLRLGKSVRFTGGLARIDALRTYATADAFLFPSQTDTQALVLNEAAYSGLPLLFSDPDVSRIAEDGQTGILLEATPEAYATAITRLIKQPALRRRLGNQAQRAAQQYTNAKQTTKLVAIYKKLLRQRPSGHA